MASFVEALDIASRHSVAVQISSKEPSRVGPMRAYLSQGLGISARPYRVDIESKDPFYWNLSFDNRPRELSQGLIAQERTKLTF